MWLVLLTAGAVAVDLLGVPAARRFPVAPPAEAVIGLYFLFAAMFRLLVRDLRIAAAERKMRGRQARRREGTPSPLQEVGFGVGRGIVQVVAGDLFSAAASLGVALLRMAATSMKDREPTQRERRRRALRENALALACIAVVGSACTLAAWEPILRSGAGPRLALGPLDLPWQPTSATLPFMRSPSPGTPPARPPAPIRVRATTPPDGAAPGIEPTPITPAAIHEERPLDPATSITASREAKPPTIPVAWKDGE